MLKFILIDSLIGYVVSKTIHANYYQIIVYALLITQLDNHSTTRESLLASIACLVVPVLSSGSGGNGIWMEGLKKLKPFFKENDPSAFKEWARAC
jgi:hypothetical protein